MFWTEYRFYRMFFRIIAHLDSIFGGESLAGIQNEEDVIWRALTTFTLVYWQKKLLTSFLKDIAHFFWL